MMKKKGYEDLVRQFLREADITKKEQNGSGDFCGIIRANFCRMFVTFLGIVMALSFITRLTHIYYTNYYSEE